MLSIAILPNNGVSNWPVMLSVTMLSIGMLIVVILTPLNVNGLSCNDLD
jgi:hypothetical protein